MAVPLLMIVVSTAKTSTCRCGVAALRPTERQATDAGPSLDAVDFAFVDDHVVGAIDLHVPCHKRFVGRPKRDAGLCRDHVDAAAALDHDLHARFALEDIDAASAFHGDYEALPLLGAVIFPEVL